MNIVARSFASHQPMTETAIRKLTRFDYDYPSLGETD